MKEEIVHLYFETFKCYPPLPFGKLPNDKYYELLYKAVKRGKPVTTREINKVFNIRKENYDLLIDDK